MWTCKQVSRSLEEQDYESLGPLEKMGLKIHVSLCCICRNYNRQRMAMHDVFRKFRQQTEQTAETGTERLPGEARKRMAEKLHSASANADQG